MINAVHMAVDRIMRQDRGRLVAILAASLNDFSLAEDALQDALSIALDKWAKTGVPQKPTAWLYQVAKRRAVDVIRRRRNFKTKTPDIQILHQEREEIPEFGIQDHRLRLIYTCCHPALDPEVQIALTLYTIGGLTVPEIARAFLVKTPTMAARLTRAKQKISKAGIPFALPTSDDHPDRLAAVLQVIYLIYNEGYSATEGQDQLRIDLCEEALFLVRMVLELAPEEAEAKGLLALILFSHARRAARQSLEQTFQPLSQQNRDHWDQDMIKEADEVLISAMQMAQIGPFQLQAAIHGLHCEGGTGDQPDWPQIAGLYTVLLRLQDTAVIRLNHAVAVSFAQGPDQGLALLVPITKALANYQPFYVAKADFLRRAGQLKLAYETYEVAISNSNVVSERRFLSDQQAKCRIN